MVDYLGLPRTLLYYVILHSLSALTYCLPLTKQFGLYE